MQGIVNDAESSILMNTLCLLREQFETGISEFALINLLKKPPYALFDEDALQDSLLLFQTHFILFNALYRLRQQWRTLMIGDLEVHTTSIKLNPLSIRTTAKDINACIELSDPLATYYLDLSNLDKTNQQDVEDMLDSFWTKMVRPEHQHPLTDNQLKEYLNTLQLSESAPLTMALLKTQYRKLQHDSHPDKGGDLQQAQLLNDAYRAIKQFIVNKG